MKIFAPDPAVNLVSAPRVFVPRMKVKRYKYVYIYIYSYTCIMLYCYLLLYTRSDRLSLYRVIQNIDSFGRPTRHLASNIIVKTWHENDRKSFDFKWKIMDIDCQEHTHKRNLWGKRISETYKSENQLFLKNVVLECKNVLQSNLSEVFFSFEDWFFTIGFIRVITLQ